MNEESSLFKSKRATILETETLTEKDKLFRIRLDSEEEINHIPGQFVEVYVPGVGEAPISISSSPTTKLFFELCIRSIGSVTKTLHNMDVGDKVGIRGPFGNGFDMNLLKGKDLILIGGGLGLAPLRSLINYVIDEREKFGKATVLYGCKKPCERLFVDELERWKREEDIEFKETVDECPEDVNWEGKTGVVTTLIPEVEFDPDTTYAVVCGPPVMYKFVMKELDDAGLPKDHRFLSFERRMRCGVGKCGHCQMGSLYVCQDGPVFKYTEIRDVPEAFV